MIDTFVEKNFEEAESDSQPKFELIKTGEDVTDHDGIKWVMITCAHCAARARLIPIHSAAVRSTDTLGATNTDYHYLCQCENCSDVTYVKFWEVDFDPDWAFRYETHYPLVSDPISVDLPPTVTAPFYEAGRCLNVGAALATVVMCRRTIEAVLSDKGAPKGRALSQSIKTLTKDHILHESMGNLADLVRLVGNIGAHHSDQEIDLAQARQTYALTKGLLDALYITPKHVAAIKERLEATRKPQERF